MEKPKHTNKTCIDPVCCMEVEPGQTRLVTIYDGHSHWFCSEDCRSAFEENPRKYLKARPTKRKGWFGCLLERLVRSKEAEFGSAGTRCH